MNSIKMLNGRIKLAKEAIKKDDLKTLTNVNGVLLKEKDAGLICAYCKEISGFLMCNDKEVKKYLNIEAFENVIYNSKDASAIYDFASEVYGANQIKAISLLKSLKNNYLASSLQKDQTVCGKEEQTL